MSSRKRVGINFWFIEKVTYPLVSIITVCYNAVETIEATILGVLNQSYSNIEYIVIDGGSRDGTVDVIRRYADRIAFWESEPDRGVYDAMNKGALRAKGEWINFMNSGDVFHDAESVARVFSEEIEGRYGAVFGDTEVIFADRREFMRYEEGLTSNPMPGCHQSIFCRRSEMLSHPFDLSFKVVSDFHFFYEWRRRGGKFLHRAGIVAIYDAREGISVWNRELAYLEKARIKYSFLGYLLRKGHFKIKQFFRKMRRMPSA